jgi:hypothetical protein
MGLWGKIHITALWTFLPRSIRNRMRVFDAGIRCETVWHGVSHVHTLSNLFYRSFQSRNPISEIVDRVDLGSSMCCFVILLDVARGPFRWELVRITEILRKILFSGRSLTLRPIEPRGTSAVGMLDSTNSAMPASVREEGGMWVS